MRKLVFKKNEVVKLVCIDDDNHVLEIERIWWEDEESV